MKALIRGVLETAAPSLVGQIRELRRRRREASQRARIDRVLSAITKDAGFIVQGGPFQGMRYIERTQWECLPAKLLGIYERELHAIVEDLVARAYDTVINVGSAEGYYAVGFARRCPAASVIAYE